MKDTSKALATRPPQTLAVDPDAATMNVQQVLGQVALIQQIMGAAMQSDVIAPRSLLPRFL